MLVTFTLALAGLAGTYPATEAVVSDLGQLVFMTNTEVERTASELVVLAPAAPEVIGRLGASGGRQIKATGPVSWGMIDGALYYQPFSIGAMGVTLTASWPLDDLLAHKRRMRDHGEPDRAAQRRSREYSMVHSRGPISPLSTLAFILTSELPVEEWGMYFDVAYTQANHITILAIRDGELHYWTSNRPEETDWNERGVFRTEIDSAFRIVQAADDMYLIDAEGRVFTSPAAGHQQVGSIRGWGDLARGERQVLLEDQTQDKIAVVEVANGVVTVLEFAGDAAVVEDFLTEITSTELQASLVQMAEILDDEEGGG